jgi:cytochrome P450
MAPVSAIEALFSPEGREDPFPYYAALHEHGPVIDLGGNAVVVGYEALARALRNPSLKEQGSQWLRQKRPDWVGHPATELLTSALPLTGGSDHARVRRLVSKAFTPGGSPSSPRPWRG